MKKSNRILNVFLACLMVFSSIGVSAEEQMGEAGLITYDEVTSVAVSGEKTMLYVAKDGSDSNDGTINSPFATLKKARDAIRELKKEGKLGEGGAIVYIREGEYLIQESLELTAEDSGTKDAPVIYRNYPGEEVSFTGGANISPDLFKKVTNKKILNKIVDEEARNKVVSVDLFALGYTELPEQTWPGAYSYIYLMDTIHGKQKPEAIASELIIDGTAMTIARYPNDDYMYIDKVIEPGEHVRKWNDDEIGTEGYIPPEDRKTTPFTITVDDERVTSWVDAKDALIYGYFFFSWADQTVPVASVNPKELSITSKYPSVYQVKEGQYFYIYNLLEEIDMPGEYFIDREAGMLYLYPPESGIGTVMYTTLDKYMFTLTDTEYVTIKGIKMGYMRNGAVNATNIKNCEIVDCEITYTGKRAVTISGSDNRVYDCYIYDVEGGVTISGGDRATLTNGNNIIENCEFEECSRISTTYMPAVVIQGCGNMAINNKIHGADHTVLQFSGNEHTIAYNEIYDACRFTDDMGAVYTGRAITQRGNKVIHNYFHDIGSPDLGTNGVHAIFFDDFWASAKVEGNVFENITGYGMMGAGSYNEINNNIFINVQKGIVNANRSFTYGASSADAMKSYIHTFTNELKNVPWQSELWQAKYPEISRIDPENGEFDVNNYIQIKNNVMFNSAELRISDIAKRTATVENNVSFGTDPGFYDFANRNYLLRADSEVYERIADFQPILFTKMGQYSHRAINRVKDAYVFCVESPYIIKNGEKVKADKNGATVIEGKIYIPLRAGVEAVGGTLEYDEATEEIKISTDTKQVSFKNGVKMSINLNGAEYTLVNSIVNIDYTNYISAEDLVNIFEKSVSQYGSIIIISNVVEQFDRLFVDKIDDGLLRYLEAQLSVY